MLASCRSLQNQTGSCAVQVPPNYDSLLGKLIVWAEDRPAAINRMRRALNELVISGVPTTIQYHTMILDIDDFQKGIVDTGFIPSHAEELKEPPPSPKQVGFLLLVFVPCLYLCHDWRAVHAVHEAHTCMCYLAVPNWDCELNSICIGSIHGCVEQEQCYLL